VPGCGGGVRVVVPGLLPIHVVAGGAVAGRRQDTLDWGSENLKLKKKETVARKKLRTKKSIVDPSNFRHKFSYILQKNRRSDIPFAKKPCRQVNIT